jgi:Condensation domain/TubC N-terminal docking domain
MACRPGMDATLESRWSPEQKVTSLNIHATKDTAVQVLEHIRSKGVLIWSENGQLRYKSPRGKLTSEDIESLRESRDQILALLAASPSMTDGRFVPAARPRIARAPLTFSQLAHWNLFRLGERPSLRQLASAIRLSGPLDSNALRRSLAELVRRHDALRTRIVVRDGIPAQEIGEATDPSLEVDDLTGVPEHCRDAEISYHLKGLVLEPINLAQSPLFAARLLRFSSREHVLIVALDHLIADAQSINILFRDLHTAYGQASRGRDFFLPPITLQFPEYATRQQNNHPTWVEQNGAYWNERFARCRRVQFPEGASSSCTTRPGWATVPLEIGKHLNVALHEWCRLRRTTPAMSVFTAYVALVSRWCDTADFVIQYQTTGRPGPEVENTIGYFASPMNLRIVLARTHTLLDLTNQVGEEYCNAYEHVDYSYAGSRLPRPGMTLNSCFNWIPQDPQTFLASLPDSADSVEWSLLPFDHPMLGIVEMDTEPFTVLTDTGDRLVGHVYFPAHRFSESTIVRFARNFLVFIAELLRNPAQRVQDIPLV